MNQIGGSFEMLLPAPSICLAQVFAEIKTMQKDNLSQIPAQSKDEKPDEEIKGLKFIAKKIKILLEKNKKIQYNEASRILISNFASQEKAQKNIKRRVYDAINVLVSSGVITKDDTKIQLVHQKRNNKTAKPAFSKQQFAKSEQISLKRLAQKYKIVRNLKHRISILSKIYNASQKEKGRKKQQKYVGCAIPQAYYVVPVKGNAEEVNISQPHNQKKKCIKLKGCKFVSKPVQLVNFLCQNPPM